MIPGTFFSFSQPIELRFNELLSGVRSDLGIGIFGENLDVLQEKADAIAAVLRSIPGSTGVKAQMLGGLPFLRIEVDRDRIARYGINAADVLDAVAALGGKVVGQVVEGQRRFALQVRFGPQYRNEIETIRTLKIADPQGRMIALEDLAEVRMEDDTYEIWRKDRQRRIMVQSNVRGRDLASFVAEAQRRVAAEVPLPRGYSLEWGGTFENLQSATKRLTVVVPLALALVFLLLYSTFHSIKLGDLDLPVGPARRDRRHPGPLAPRTEFQHLGGRRLHRPVGGRRPGRPGPRLGDPPTRSRRGLQSARRSRRRRCPGSDRS